MGLNAIRLISTALFFTSTAMVALTWSIGTYGGWVFATVAFAVSSGYLWREVVIAEVSEDAPKPGLPMGLTRQTPEQDPDPASWR